jgi:hypothetical protein
VDYYIYRDGINILNIKGGTVPTLTIDQTTRGSDILSFMGAERLFAVRQGTSALLTPTIESDGADGIESDDYPDTTSYLNAIPGAVERLLSYRDLPDSEFKPAPRSSFCV